MNIYKQKIAILSIVLLSFVGCSNNGRNHDGRGNHGQDNSYRNTQQGAAIGAGLGAVTGAIIGYQGGRGKGALRGALIGGVAGGALGAGVGRYMDKQQAEFERQLAAERRTHQLEIQRLQNETLRITMNNEVSFGFNSSVIKPAFRRTLNKVSDVLKRYNRSMVRVVGYTDSIGTASYNLQLSRRRADAVAWYMEERGIAAGRIASEGRGESAPRASNQTEAGRQLNRRVEILVVPDPNIQ
ncbi:MAG: OmpA family protein [Mariprofundaceae bacterium]|nr:OmpA family protein [Mariprofundaceae bacterium]